MQNGTSCWKHGWWGSDPEFPRRLIRNANFFKHIRNCFRLVRENKEKRSMKYSGLIFVRPDLRYHSTMTVEEISRVLGELKNAPYSFYSFCDWVYVLPEISLPVIEDLLPMRCAPSARYNDCCGCIVDPEHYFFHRLNPLHLRPHPDVEL